MTTRQDRRRRTGDANPPADVAAGDDQQSQRAVAAGVEFALGHGSCECAESGGRAPDDGRAHLSGAFVGVRCPGRRRRSVQRCVPAGFRCCGPIHVQIRRLQAPRRIVHRSRPLAGLRQCANGSLDGRRDADWRVLGDVVAGHLGLHGATWKPYQAGPDGQPTRMRGCALPSGSRGHLAEGASRGAPAADRSRPGPPR